VDDRLAAELDAFSGSNEEYVRAVYRLVLRRDPDGEARERAREKLAKGTLSRATLLAELVATEEHARIRQLDDAVASALAARGRGERLRRLTGPPWLDERIVEVPWVLARLAEGTVLDVGYAFAEPVYLAALVRAGCERLTGVDLAERDVRGLEAVVADVRALPFDDESFDQALVVSTLEHVGEDNTVYGVSGERAGGRLEALRELRRVLKPRGRLLVTVPTGEPGDHGWFRQEDVDGWQRLYARAGFFVEEQEIYELTSAGWAANPAFRPEGVRYGERGSGASAVLCAELSPRRLRRLVAPSGIKAVARRRLGPSYARLRGAGH
jgi:SAM-dependent methyltransferase